MAENSSTNLGIMMNALRISGRTLAEMLNIHYSLVSKWVNGKRPLKQNSDYLKQIADIFINLDKPNKCSVIRHILADNYPDADFDSDERIHIYLKRFLSTDRPIEAELSDWDVVDRSKISSRCKLDVYQNASGRQHALMRLVESANKLSGKHEILIHGNESVDWMKQKNAFNYLDTVQARHLQFLKNGGHITIIHSVNRTDHELVQSILTWLPLHLTKKTDAYYIPEYSNIPVRLSMTILQGKAAAFGFSAENTSPNLTTYYSTDLSMVRKMEELFNGFAYNSIPLFKHSSGNDSTSSSLEFSARNSNSIMYSKIPFQYCFNSSDFKQLLEENNVDIDQHTDAMIFCDLDQKRLFSTLDKHNTYLMIDYDDMCDSIKNGTYISYMNWIAEKNLWASPEMVKKAYLKLCDNVLANPNLHVCLLDSSQFSYHRDITLLVKENTSFLANSVDQDIHGPVTIKEPTIVSAIYKYLDRARKSAPKPYREKEYVTDIIRKICAES